MALCKAAPAADEGRLCPYAARFPKPKKVGNPHANCEAEAQHDSAVFVVQCMVTDLSLAPLLKAYLESRRKHDSAKVEESQGRWHKTYMVLEKLSKEWVAEWLAVLSQEGDFPLTVSLLNRIDMQNSEHIKIIFHFVTFTSASTKLPREMLDKQVCGLALKRRAAELGDRISLVAVATASNGVIDFLKLGVYKLGFDDDGNATSITHIQGQVATIPEHIRIDKTFELIGNEHDLTAEVKKGPARFFLHDFFPKTSSPWVHVLDKKATHLVKLAQDSDLEVRTKNAEAQAGTVVGKKVLTEATRERRIVIAEKARAKRAAAPAKRRKTVVSLGAVVA